MTDLIHELIIESASDFQHHLNPNNNERILFSGKYGKGKTTFLKAFFEQQSKFLKQEKDLYYTLFLDPVNYSVATNEDIFRYIKYDIVFGLIEKNPEISDVDFSFQEAAPYYITKHPHEFVKSLLEFIPKVGKPLSESIAAIEQLYQKIATFHKDLNEQSETARLVKFLEQFDLKDGSIYESDLITHLIQKILERGKGDKKSVLVIDNLDRIDPEHIFRILNVFSVHLDYHWQTGKTNKFGFDKIILVCDIHNIRNIFKNRYGINVDFNGYVDKFYSTEVFHFQNYRQIENVVSRLMTNFLIDYNGSKKAVGYFVGKHLVGLESMLSAFVYDNIVSLRQVMNFTRTPMWLQKDEVVIQGKIIVPLKSDTPVLELMILSKILGGFGALENAIQKLSSSDLVPKYFDELYRRAMYYETKYHHEFRSINTTVTIPLRNTFYQADIHADGTNLRELNIYIPKTASVRDHLQPTLKEFYTLYLKILNELHNEKLIQ